MEIKRLYHFQCSTKQSPAPTSGAGDCEINTTKGENKEMKHFFKKALSLALAILFTLGAVSVTAFAGLLPAAAEGESTLGATAACSGHTLGTFSGVPACVNDWNGGLHICENNFPDNTFCNYVSNSDFDVDGNGYFTVSEIEAVKEIRCEDSNIASLQGIEFLSNLTILFCDDNYNRLTSLDVSNNTALTTLSCDYNQLTSLDVSNNTALTTLSCGSNQLRSLDVSNNVNLASLVCFFDKLTSLDLSNNAALTYLDCSGNQLTSLDVSNNTALTKLDCDGNQFTSLDVSNNVNLAWLVCYNNQLTSLDVSKNIELTTLSCGRNQLTSLDVSNNAALTALVCEFSQLTALDISNNVKLTDLYCYDNQLTALDVSNNTALAALRCYNNQLTSLDVSNNVALAELWCYNNQLTSLDVSNNVNLASLVCFNNQLTSLDVSNNATLTYLDCSGNELTSLDVSKNTKLGRPRCDTQSIEIIVANRKVFDMRTLISEENLSKVTIDSNIGTYDPETGIITFNAERTSFKYYYDIGKDGKTMGVYVTLKMHEHTYGDYVSNGDGTHTRHCTFEGCTDTETENCSGGTATCKDKAVCEICGEEYGELNPENHTGKEVWEQTETKHTKKWNCCGKVTVAEADHEFENGICTVCAYLCTHKDENTDHKCDVCGMTVSEHIDSDNNHLCDICGKAITNHVDENNNHVCDICGKAVSNHIDSNKDHICDICGKAISNHIDDNKDHICDICGKAVSNHVDDNKDHVCDICGKTVTNHIDDDNNHLCDLCGKTVSNHSDENHDHLCDICGETISTHTGGSATCKDKAICELCGEEYGELNPENHTGGTHIEHEKAATCTEKGYTGDTYCSGCNVKISDGSEIPTKPHTPGEKWVIENGKKVKKCTECGAIAETAPRMPGDVDGDGEITMLDCLYLKRYILGTYNGEIVLENADVDGNGRIDATDYLYLKRGYLGTFDLSKFA